MNFALPSGSSPPEKPPGSMTIWLLSMALTSALQLSATSAGVRLRMTRISGSAPARAKALAVSYSQLVPGNTGMMTLGFATPILGAAGAVSLPLIFSTVGACLAVGVHRLQLAFPDLLQLGHIQLFAAGFKDVFLGGARPGSHRRANRTPFPERWSHTWAGTSHGWSYPHAS